MPQEQPNRVTSWFTEKKYTWEEGAGWRGGVQDGGNECRVGGGKVQNGCVNYCRLTLEVQMSMSMRSSRAETAITPTTTSWPSVTSGGSGQGQARRPDIS